MDDGSVGQAGDLAGLLTSLEEGDLLFIVKPIAEEQRQAKSAVGGND